MIAFGKVPGSGGSKESQFRPMWGGLRGCVEVWLGWFVGHLERFSGDGRWPEGEIELVSIQLSWILIDYRRSLWFGFARTAG